MKLLSCISFCLVSIPAFTQIWTYPSTGTTSFIGAVGIGTTTPQNTFEVVGSGQFLRNPVSTSYATFRLYNNENSLFRTLEIDYSGSQYPGALVNDGPIGESGSITTTGSYPLTLGTNNTRRVTISAAGNVGIGITSPTATLHVLQSSNNDWAGIIENNGGNGKGLRIRGAAGNLTPLLQIEDNYLTNRFLVRSDGNVGIGTTTPSSRLHIFSPSSTLMRFERPGSNVFGYEIGLTSFGLYDYTTLKYKWRTSGGNVLLVEVEGSGNVGIGTTSPG